MLINVGNLVHSKIETHTEIVGAQDAMQVGYGCEFLSHQSAIESVQSFYTFVFTLEVSFHETHIGSKVLKERSSKRTAKHSDSHMRVLLCQRINDGYSHGNISHG